MKKIEAIVREERLPDVMEALADAGFPALTLYEVHGRGEQRGIIRSFRGREFRIDLLPKVKVEVICGDSDVERVVDLIIRNARTGAVGDGKIFVLPVEGCIRIRTGEGRATENTGLNLNGLPPENSAVASR